MRRASSRSLGPATVVARDVNPQPNGDSLERDQVKRDSIAMRRWIDGKGPMPDIPMYATCLYREEFDKIRNVQPIETDNLKEKIESLKTVLWIREQEVFEKELNYFELRDKTRSDAKRGGQSSGVTRAERADQWRADLVKFCEACLKPLNCLGPLKPTKPVAKYSELARHLLVAVRAKGESAQRRLNTGSQSEEDKIHDQQIVEACTLLSGLPKARHLAKQLPLILRKHPDLFKELYNGE